MSETGHFMGAKELIVTHTALRDRLLSEYKEGEETAQSLKDLQFVDRKSQAAENKVREVEH